MPTSSHIESLEQRPQPQREIALPAPTAWPIVLAFGCILMFAGLLTSASVSVLGLILSVAGCVGWFRELFPHENEERVAIAFEVPVIATTRRVVERVPIAPELVRAWLPIKTYPISAGIKTTTKIMPVTLRTKKDSRRIESVGVERESKMLEIGWS